ncbi:hypothetical protein [Spiroplasma endosymbiont of Nebria brevicollis]|uniref:hypothetical protein n=1 Tax=Spiroplasma endosymbiont of Nebria brevicollis TaxID=3066284 RepID=UPI00313C90B3
MAKAVKNNATTTKPKKKKDPNAPKGPMNAFFFFLKEKRTEFKAKHPELKPAALVKEMNKLWIELEIIDKEQYQELANADRERYYLATGKKPKPRKKK